MKVHPVLVLILVLSALGGAFAIGRLAKVSSSQAGEPVPATTTVHAMPAAGQVVATGRQHAQIETPQGTFTIEASMEPQ